MILSKTTPCQLIVIKTPVWNKRKIGIATFRVGNHNEIRIEQTNKDGEKIYPMPFYITGEEIKKYPVEPVKSAPHVKLYIVPIEDLQTLERV